MAGTGDHSKPQTQSAFPVAPGCRVLRCLLVTCHTPCPHDQPRNFCHTSCPSAVASASVSTRPTGARPLCLVFSSNHISTCSPEQKKLISGHVSPTTECPISGAATQRRISDGSAWVTVPVL